MLVQQERNGWIGIVLNGWCANKDEHFAITFKKWPRKITPVRESTSATRLYLRILLIGIKGQNDFPEKQNMIDTLEKMSKEYKDIFINELKSQRNNL